MRVNHKYDRLYVAASKNGVNLGLPKNSWTSLDIWLQLEPGQDGVVWKAWNPRLAGSEKYNSA